MAEDRTAQFHHQLRAAAPGGAWRAAPCARTRRRGGGARRSAYRAAPSRHRKADRSKDLSAGDSVFRPARLRRADEPGARLLSRGRKTSRHRHSQACAAHSRALLRDRAAAVASSQRHHAGHGCRRAHPAAVGFRGAREADGVLRARVGLAHARGLFPRRRRAPGFAAETDRRHLGVLRPVPQGLRRSRRAADRKSHFQAAQRQYRRGEVSKTPGHGVFPASWCAARARPGICARRSPTSAIPSSISTSRSARTATATIATASAWRRCASRCAS